MTTRALSLSCLVSFVLISFVVLTTPCAAQSNEQAFYNTSLFGQTSATRATVDKVDQIFFTQPVDFRRNAGPATGWRVTLQDQNPRTAETIRLSYHPLELQSLRPRPNAVASVQYTAFGSGGSGARAFIYTFSTPSPVTLPEFHAFGLRMPRPNAWPADALTLHFQRGDRTRVSASRRQEWSYKLDSFGLVVPEWRTGSTFRFGGLYATPVLQAFNGSNAYTRNANKNELFGPESLAFETGSGRSDALGFRASAGRAYRTLGSELGLAAVYFSSNYRPFPVTVPPFGTLLIDELTMSFLAYMILDQNGQGRTLGVEVPRNLNVRIAWQAFFVSIDTSTMALRRFTLSNGIRTNFR